MHGEATPTSQHPDCSTGSLGWAAGAGNEIFLGGEGRGGSPLPSPALQSCNAPGLACLPRVTLLEFVGLERWAEIRSAARGAGGLGVPQGGSSPGREAATLKELLGVREGALGKLYRLKAELGDVSPLLVYAAGRPGLWLSATPPQLRILFDNINISVYFTLWC